MGGQHDDAQRTGSAVDFPTKGIAGRERLLGGGVRFGYGQWSALERASPTPVPVGPGVLHPLDVLIAVAIVLRPRQRSRVVGELSLRDQLTHRV